MPVVDPTRDLEDQLFAHGAPIVFGCDEAGRGAIAGPCAVGIVALTVDTGAHPAGLRDSKMLSEKKRNFMLPLVTQWAPASAVGLASATEIEELGITKALALAGHRALSSVLEQLGGRGLPTTGRMILDGTHNWFGASPSPGIVVGMREKADRDCVSVAGASVLAKVHRDTLMIEASTDFPAYGWDGNKGYGAANHYAAIREHGLIDGWHRASWIKQ